MKLELTDSERLILANQYRILAHLEEESSYQDLSDQLLDGHSWLYGDALDRQLSAPLSEEDQKYVVDVLAIYDALHFSYRDLEDKSGIDPHKVEFPGFDGNNECHLMHFAHALRKDNRFVELIPEHGKNSHCPTSARYERLLENYKKMGEPRFQLSKAQILELLS